MNAAVAQVLACKCLHCFPRNKFPKFSVQKRKADALEKDPGIHGKIVQGHRSMMFISEKWLQG
jgi:hypothetical protein